MKRLISRGNQITLILLLLPVFVFSQETKPYNQKEAFDLIKSIEGTPFVRTENPGAQWFPDAGLGLFIHWGIHSVAALDPSWAMIKNCTWAKDRNAVPVEEYYHLANEFNPSQYDPDEWILAAKQAGFQYVVLTTKHHDGYCLWPSAYGDWNTGKYMQGRDLLKPYVEACRKYGMKVGFYFSPRDWGNPIYPIPYVDYDYEQKGTADTTTEEYSQQKFDEFFETTVGQLSEILTRYGKIDLLWFDGVGWPNVDTHSETLHAWLREIQPEMVINPRWQTNNEQLTFGDYKTEEVTWGNHPEEKPEDINESDWWEFCNSWSGGWGYSPTQPFRDLNDIMRIFVYARSFGGNYLLNVGPAPDGTMRPGYYAECEKLAAWMKNHKESVVGTEEVPGWKEISNVPLTQNDNCIYAHVLKEQKGGIILKVTEKPVSVTLLRNGKALDYEVFRRKEILINLDNSDREMLNDVVKIAFKK